jgi:hypothetical protein
VDRRLSLTVEEVSGSELGPGSAHRHTESDAPVEIITLDLR